MHITIMALGSRGDVLPCVALGAGLQAAGHRVRFVTSANFRPMVESRDLELHAIQFDAEALMRSAGGLQMARAGRNFVRTAFSIFRTFGALAGQYAQDLSAPILLETDAVINQLPGSLFGLDIAEKTGVPYFSATVIPLARTRTAPMLAFPAGLGGVPGFNVISYRVAEQLVWQYFRPTINRWRREVLGLPMANFVGPFGQLYARGIPMLNRFSPLVIPRPPDWADHIYITGYWFADETDWAPSENLLRFLESAPAPVYFGFGSMPLADPDLLVEQISSVLARHDQRGILGAGLADGRGSELPEHLMAVDYAPFQWLFSRVSAVFHHGGSGTTAHNLRAGVPGVVVPFLFDQFYWGRRLMELGVGAPIIPYQRFTEKALVTALERVVSDREMGAKARALGSRLREENGILNAVKVVERHLLGSDSVTIGRARTAEEHKSSAEKVVSNKRGGA